MNKLNKTFLSGNILTAAELNSLTAKIDEIVTNWPTPGDDNQNDGLTDEDVQNKVDAAKAQLQDLIDEMNASIASLLAQVEGLKEGTTTVDNKEEFLKALRQQCNVVLLDLNLTKKITLPDGTEQIVPAIDLAVIQEDVDDLKSSVAALEVLPGKIGMIANHFDENGNPIYNGAEIIAAINNEGESTVGISADKVIISGDVTLTNKLTALSADIANINVPDTATIANAVINDGRIQSAVISDIEAGNVTITGTLYYNKIIGNVTSVSSTTQLGDNAYFVQFTGGSTADLNQYPTITLPSNPETGQTVFINIGSKCWKLSANKSIDYFYIYDQIGNGEYSIWSGRVNTGETINVADSGWNGVVQFIYTGTMWQQLIHNIRV